jgi:S-phase kinase-associated protein 1
METKEEKVAVAGQDVEMGFEESQKPTGQEEESMFSEQELEQVVKLVFSEHHQGLAGANVFSMPIKHIQASKMIATCVRAALDSNTMDEIIIIPNLSEATFEKIKVWLEYSSVVKPTDMPAPVQTTDFATIASPWEAAYLDLGIDDMDRLVNGALYLDIRKLFVMVCSKLATMLVDATPYQIRQKMGVEHIRFSDQEEAQMLEENRIATTPIDLGDGTFF